MTETLPVGFAWEFGYKGCPLKEQKLGEMSGGCVGTGSAKDALKEGKATFWGDALWTEPYEGMLQECKNAILTPHICTYTTQCRTSMEKQAVENLLKDLEEMR